MINFKICFASFKKLLFFIFIDSVFISAFVVHPLATKPHAPHWGPTSRKWKLTAQHNILGSFLISAKKCRNKSKIIGGKSEEMWKFRIYFHALEVVVFVTHYKSQKSWISTSQEVGTFVYFSLEMLISEVGGSLLKLQFFATSWIT